MEPSLDAKASVCRRRPDDWDKIKSSEKRNFSYSLEDFILHFCVSKYLCQGEQTYYLTDLSKGAMHVKDADAERRQRYERWFPLLKDELLQVVGKPGETRLIAIGDYVSNFLKRKDLCARIEGVLHYSARAAGHREKKIKPWIEAFPEFRQRVNLGQIMTTAKAVMEQGGYSQKTIRTKLRQLQKGSGLTESRKALMFYYKNRFEELRTASHIVLSEDEQHTP